MPARSGRITLLALLLPAFAAVAGCDGEADPPAGIDGLTIPTPSPYPGDFVAVLDNPWWSLAPGEAVVLTGTTGTATLRVEPDPVTVEEVTSYVVTLDQALDGSRGPVSWSWSFEVTQDEDVNLWMTAMEEWRAGVDGAGAGLLLPARPRAGDGYAVSGAADVVDIRGSVTAVTGDRAEITLTFPDEDEADQVATYEKGVGLVRLETAYGVFERS